MLDISYEDIIRKYICSLDGEESMSGEERDHKSTTKIWRRRRRRNIRRLYMRWELYCVNKLEIFHSPVVWNADHAVLKRRMGDANLWLSTVVEVGRVFSLRKKS